MNREELEGVISHEMSHIKNHDIRLLLVVGTMIGMAALLASILWRSAFYAGMGRGGRITPASCSSLSFLLAPCWPSSGSWWAH